MLHITQKLIPITSTGRRPRGRMTAQSITIHSTANPNSTAMDEVMNIINHDPYKNVSFHFAVDDIQAVQAIPINEHAWHAGDGEDGPGNLTSIAIEICESGDRLQTLANSIALVQILFKQTGLTVKDLRQHHDWSGKNCPRILRDPAYVKDGLDWEWFLSQFAEEDETMTEPTYRTLADVPKWGQSTIEKVIKHGGLTPVNGEINITLTMLRVYVSLDKMNKL